MKNNIRYKGNINSTSVIIFLIRRQKLPAMLLCLGKPTLLEVFVMLVVVVHSFLCLHFVVVLHSFFVLHFVVLFLCDTVLLIAFQRHPSPFRELSLGFYTHFILSAQSITE